MPAVLSTVATKQALALIRGPSSGSHAPESAANLRILDDKATVPVGAPAIVAATDYVRFGKLNAGARIILPLCILTTDHTAAIAGKLQLVPLDGTAATDIAGVTVNLAAATITGMPEADTVVVAKDSWIQFVPTADLTIATTAKVIRAKIVYGQTY